MSESNGFKLRALTPSCTRIAVKSNVQSSWMLSYKKYSMLSKPAEYEVGMDKNELVVISLQDQADHAAIEIEPLGEKVGTIIAQRSRGGTKTLRVGTKTRFEMAPGESIVLRGSRIVHPTHSGAGLAV